MSVPETFDQNAFVYYLLERVCEIQRAIRVTGPNSNIYAVQFAHPRWWQPIGNDPFPGFFNRARRLSSTKQGRPIRTDLYQVTMRLIIGPAFSGYQGEYEDTGNLLYAAVLNAFDAQQRLAVPGAQPPDNYPLQYVVAASIPENDNGIEAREYDEAPQTVYMCLDIPLGVQANAQVPRQS